MKKTLLLMSFLLAIVAMPTTAQKKFIKKRATMQLIKKRAQVGNQAFGVSTQSVYTLGNSIFAGYYEAAGSGVTGYENYYLLLSDQTDASYDAKEGKITAKNAKVLALDLYAPEGTGIDMPAGTFTPASGDLFYNADYSYIEQYDADGTGDGGNNLSGNITIAKAEKEGSNPTYTITVTDASGNTYSYEGELSFTNMSTGSSNVYPQISTDINTTFTGTGIGYYYGNLMESQTGNMVLNLYDCDHDNDTGGMTAKGHDLVINLFNRLFGDPKTATIVPGTYTVARNFHVNTFFPGMEIDYMGMTVIMGTYVKRRKAVTGMDTDYDYCYIADGTITITEGEKEGTYDFDIDLVTDRGHKVKGTAKGISFIYVDKSESNDKDVDSNLSEDVNLKFDRVPKSRIYSLGVQNGVQVFSVDLGSPSGKDDQDYTGDQDLLRMEFQAAEGSQYLPEGTYTLMQDNHLYTNEYAPFMMTRGYFVDGGRTGTRYEHFRLNPDVATRLPWVVDKWATVYSGTVGVSKTDNNHYKFVIDLYDGNGFKITGEYDKEMEYEYNPDAITGINGITANPVSAKTEVYSLGGQKLNTNYNNLPSGIYLVKTNNKTIKIVKK